MSAQHNAALVINTVSGANRLAYRHGRPGIQRVSLASGCESKAHGRFDFWLGDWEAKTKNETAGINQISREQNGCTLRENGVSRSAEYAGISINFYNAELSQRQQISIDNQGASCVRWPIPEEIRALINCDQSIARIRFSRLRTVSLNMILKHVHALR